MGWASPEGPSWNWRTLGLAGLVVIVAAGADRARPTLITTTGSHTITRGKLSFDIYEDKGRINLRLCQKSAPGGGWEKFGPTKPPFEKGANWFVYPETPERFWVFDGRDGLELWWARRSPVSPGGIASCQVVPEIVKEAPERVRALLPKAFKDRYGVN
jgi:hypothetical protein